MIGYYSQKARQQGNSSCFYVDTLGNRVEVTGVFFSKESAEKNYMFDDKVCVGEVVECVIAANGQILTPKNVIT